METYIPLGLALIEGFHAFAHLNVLFRVSPPKASTLKERGWYFFWDGLSHLLPFFVHGRFLPYLLFGIINNYYTI